MQLEDDFDMLDSDDDVLSWDDDEEVSFKHLTHFDNRNPGHAQRRKMLTGM
jgi:hypothetical protein